MTPRALTAAAVGAEDGYWSHKEKTMPEPIDSALLYRIVERAYGERGIYALESTCLTPDDLLKGEEHCLDRIAPALEEDLGSEF